MSKFKIYFFAIAFSIFTFHSTPSQVKDFDYKNYSPSKRYSLAVYGTYVSSATIQNNPLSGDPFERGSEFELDGSYGYSAELSIDPRLGETNLIFFISAEYYRLNQGDVILRLVGDTTIKNIRTTENITMFPIEAGVKWSLPVGFDNFKIYIGGGVGVYFGSRERYISTLESRIIKKIPGFSLNILAGLEYYMSKSVSIDGQLKFREATFDVNSEYNTNKVIIDGNQYRIQTPFYSRVNVDGVRISLGFKYHF